MAHVKKLLVNIQSSFTENPLASWGLVIGILLAVLVFGGLALNAFIDRRRERQKAKAVERLLKHLESLPSQKS